MVLLQRTQDGPPGGDVDVVRPVMPHEHGVSPVVGRMQLAEAAADAQPIEDEHGDAVLEVELAAHRKARADQIHGIDRRRVRPPEVLQHLVWLAKSHVAAERRRDSRRVRLHVVHRLQNVAHQPDARPLEVVQDPRAGAPLANLLVRLGVAIARPDDAVGDGLAEPPRHPRVFGKGADVVRDKDFPDVAATEVLRRVDPQGDKDDRDVEFPDKRRKHAACAIRHHVDEQDVQVCGHHLRKFRARRLRFSPRNGQPSIARRRSGKRSECGQAHGGHGNDKRLFQSALCFFRHHGWNCTMNDFTCHSTFFVLKFHVFHSRLLCVRFMVC